MNGMVWRRTRGGGGAEGNGRGEKPLNFVPFLFWEGKDGGKKTGLPSSPPPIELPFPQSCK